MKFLVIGDKDTVTGFSLAGIEGIVANSKREAVRELQQAVNRKGVGIILIASQPPQGYGGRVCATRQPKFPAAGERRLICGQTLRNSLSSLFSVLSVVRFRLSFFPVSGWRMARNFPFFFVFLG